MAFYTSCLWLLVKSRIQAKYYSIYHLSWYVNKCDMITGLLKCNLTPPHTPCLFFNIPYNVIAQIINILPPQRLTFPWLHCPLRWCLLCLEMSSTLYSHQVFLTRKWSYLPFQIQKMSPSLWKPPLHHITKLQLWLLLCNILFLYF